MKVKPNGSFIHDIFMTINAFIFRLLLSIFICLGIASLLMGTNISISYNSNKVKNKVTWITHLVKGVEVGGKIKKAIW